MKRETESHRGGWTNLREVLVWGNRAAEKSALALSRRDNQMNLEYLQVKSV